MCSSLLPAALYLFSVSLLRVDTQVGSFVFSIVVTVLMEVVSLHHLLVMADSMDQAVGEALVQSQGHCHHVRLHLLTLDLLLDLALVNGLGVDAERNHHFDLVLGHNVKPVGSSASMALLSRQPVEKENALPLAEGPDGPVHPVVFLNE